MTRVALTVVAVALWLAAIFGVHQWSVSGSGWAAINAGIVAVFGLAALVPVLLHLWRR